MNPLNFLTDLSEMQIKELKRLIEGPLAVSWSRQYLEAAFGSRLGAIIFNRLVELSEQGWHRIQFLMLLDLFNKDRSQAGESFSWVFTGAATPDLPSRDTGVVFRSVVESAKREVLLVSFALYKGKELLAPIYRKTLESPGFKVRMILDISRNRGDTSLSSEIVTRFKHEFKERHWPGEPWPELYYDPRGLEADPQKKAVVHAKCLIADEHTAFVTSANLTEAAQEKNVEVGVLIKDSVKVRQLKDYFIALTDSSFSRIPLEFEG